MNSIAAVTTTAATLPFQLLSDQATLPTRAHPGDAGLDLYAAEAATVEPGGGRAAVGTGLAVEIPPGHGGLVLPRSGLAARRGIGLATEADAYEAVDDRQVALQALGFLTPRQRAAIVLTEVLQYTAEEAGSMLGIHASTVRALHFQARSALKSSGETADA